MPDVNGTHYHDGTPDAVIRVLEAARQSGRKYRLRIWLGDASTGKTWEDAPETGYIGRSTGQIKIPLLISNKRSMGGPGLLDHCIVKIAHANKRNGGVLYQHSYFYETFPENRT